MSHDPTAPRLKFDCPSTHPTHGKCFLEWPHDGDEGHGLDKAHRAAVVKRKGWPPEPVYWTNADIEAYEAQGSDPQDHHPIPTSIHPPSSDRISPHASMLRRQMIREYVRVGGEGLTDYEMHVIPRIAAFEGDPHSPNNSATPSQIAGHRGFLRDHGIVKKAGRRLGLTGHWQTVWTLTPEYEALVFSDTEGVQTYVREIAHV